MRFKLLRSLLSIVVRTSAHVRIGPSPTLRFFPKGGPAPAISSADQQSTFDPERLSVVVMAMPVMMREVFMLYLAGSNSAAIAMQLGVSAEAVRDLLVEALVRLDMALGSQPTDPC